MTNIKKNRPKRVRHKQKRNLHSSSFEDRLIKAESGRRLAENNRLDAEIDRQRQAADQSVSEEKRDSAEWVRNRSEHDRLYKEDKRGKSEELRQAAEEARSAAEKLRVASEEARKSAELLREATVEQQEIFREMRQTIQAFDQAASQYLNAAEQLKRERLARGL